MRPSVTTGQSESTPDRLQSFSPVRLTLHRHACKVFLMELIEVDTETGEEAELLATGSERRMLARMAEILCEVIASEDNFKIRLRIQAEA